MLFNILLITSDAKKKKKHKHGNKKNKAIQVVPSLSVQIPVIPIPSSCPCAAAAVSDASGPCKPSIYIDYYYNPPFSGYPANASYLPPAESIPAIIERLTSIRDITKNFVHSTKQEKDDVKEALYIKNNFGNVHHILKAISKAANNTNT